MTDHLLDRVVSAVGTQYLVDAEIGRGGMAVVYRATDLRLHRRVAIKVLPPELAFNADVRERFLREASTAAQLTHPGIVPIYTVDEREGIVYFVMALVEGESLAARLAREPRLPVDQTRQILAGVADALAYAHAQGVVHRDVKPDNIMLDRGTGRTMVTDFGIARAAQGDTRLTVTGVAIGTPAYMSPEQALGERELDGRSDIYSLGVIGYQMLAGETPFKASNTPAMLVKHVSETPRPLATLRPDVPAGLAYAIARALAKKPEDRWPDALAFRSALLDTTSTPPPPAPEPRYQVPPAYAAPPVPILSNRPPPYDHMDIARLREGFSPMVPAMPPMPPAPVWGTKADWREWRRERKTWQRESKRRLLATRGIGDHDAEWLGAEERLVRFRRHVVSSATTIGALAAVNVLTSPHFLWFLFPGTLIAISALARAGKLWADGVPFSGLFRRGTPGPVQRAALAASGTWESVDAALQRMASADVLHGPYADTLRRAASDFVAIREMLAQLPATERAMIPDVAPTVDALAERVGALATTLHRLDQDIGGSSLKLIDARLAAVRAESRGSPSAEQERRMSLLERQRVSITELSERRNALLTQLDSAALALQNLRLDLLKLRSSGLESAMSDVASATQEARALSREIANAVDAVREVKGL